MTSELSRLRSENAEMQHKLAEAEQSENHARQRMAEAEAMASALTEQNARLREALEETQLCLAAWSQGRGPHDATTAVLNRARATLSTPPAEEKG